MEQLITTKAVGVAEARKRAQSLQQEAKELLLKASQKLQQLKGDTSCSSVTVTQQLKTKGFIGAVLHVKCFRFFVQI